MRIHSSSLTFVPAGYNKHQAAPATDVANANANAAETVKSSPQPSSTSKIQKVLASAQANGGNNLIALNNQANPKTHKALNAYLQELNQPLHDQTAQLITGLDTYA